MLLSMYALAETRVALIIGNSVYQKPDMRLANPANDAKAMADKLQSAGFVTIVKYNAKRADFYHALNEFSDKIARDPHAVGLFYYAGHAVQADGVNYLIPVDAEIEAQSDLEPNAFDAGRVLKSMAAAQNEMNIVILDACRNNPLPKTRGMDRGLARIDAPSGTFIAFSAGPGQTAQDGAAGSNGVFTGEFLKAMSEPGLPLEQVFKKVIIGVKAATKGAQTPWQESSLQGDFFFYSKGGGVAAGNAPNDAKAAPPAASVAPVSTAPVSTAPRSATPTSPASASRSPVEPGAQGMWTMKVPSPQGISTCYWDVRANGTYSAWCVGPAPVAHAGTVSVADGRWTLSATTTNYTDGGTYVFANPNTMVMTGKLGTGAWLRAK
jgi:hypothetical protein